MAEAVGGTRAYISRRPGLDHWLTRAVGQEAAATLADHFTTGRTGGELEFPVEPGGFCNGKQRCRARRLAELADQSHFTVTIARELDITTPRRAPVQGAPQRTA